LTARGNAAVLRGAALALPAACDYDSARQGRRRQTSIPTSGIRMKQGVLVIDVQRALCQGEFAAFEADRVIERTNLVTRRARRAGAPVVFIQHEEDGGVFRPGGEGWQLADGLEVFEADLHVRKRATDSFHQTELATLLREHGVTDLVVCGIQSEFCVDTTVRRALALGFPVTLVADGHSTVDNGVLTAAQISRHHNVTLSNITSFGPRARAVAAVDVTFAG
jgi:nicotinamidase-related amidase